MTLHDAMSSPSLTQQYESETRILTGPWSRTQRHWVNNLKVSARQLHTLHDDDDE